MIFQYQNTDIFYQTYGEGPVVICLHGWGCTHEVFAPLATLLSVGYRVYSLDLPGFGQSQEPPTVWGIEDYVQMLEAFISDLVPSQQRESLSLIGHSFGGRMSILYASRHTLSRVVLVDAAGIKPKRPLSYYIKVYTYKLIRFFLLNVLRAPQCFERYRAGKGSADYNAASPRMKAVLSKVVNEDLTHCLPAISAPTLLFWGEKDTATPLSDALLMEKKIPDAGLVRVPGAGHFSFVEAPALFAKVMASFFKIQY
ncbi:MAG: alpha/beta hydrolase [Bacteroidales bacterium]|nr:alpha/beta hydrolase [Bacteroidales bacterium]